MKFTGALVFAASATLAVAQSLTGEVDTGLAARDVDVGLGSVPGLAARAPLRIEPRAPNKNANANAGEVKNKAGAGGNGNNAEAKKKKKKDKNAKDAAAAARNAQIQNTKANN